MGDIVIAIFTCSGCHTIPQIGWLKRLQFIFSQLWRLEVQDQGISKVDFS